MRSPLLLSFFVALACGAESSGDDVARCVPGEQRACACPGGAPAGAQVCLDTGDRFGTCFGCGLAGSTGTLGDESGTTDAAPGTASGDAASGDAASSAPASGDPASSGGGEPASSSEGGADTGPVPGAPSGPPQAVPPAPPPDGSAVVDQVAAEHPDWLAKSCVDMGGDNQFMFEVVRRLRQQDERWGLNWKRGVIGDLSQDIVDYHYGNGVSEESTDVYIIDIIVGHCGDTPQAGWIDVTQATLDANTVGMWTLAGQQL